MYWIFWRSEMSRFLPYPIGVLSSHCYYHCTRYFDKHLSNVSISEKTELSTVHSGNLLYLNKTWNILQSVMLLLRSHFGRPAVVEYFGALWSVFKLVLTHSEACELFSRWLVELYAIHIVRASNNDIDVMKSLTTISTLHADMPWITAALVGNIGQYHKAAFVLVV